jgi:hypothetical protein
LHRCGSAPLHLCTCSNQYTLDFLCLQLGCTPAPTHPATAGEKGAATAGATFCPEADLSRLKVDRVALLEKIKARKALGDDELECVHLGLVRCNAAAGATLCPEADLSRLKVDRAALLEKIKARKALGDDELECVHLGLVACGAPTRTAAPTHCGLVRARASAGSKQLCTPAPTPGNGRREGRCCGRRHPLPGG